MYNAWDSNMPLPKIAELKQIKAKYTTVKPFEPEKDGYIFLHGVALANYKSKLFCAWAHNKVLENSDDEEVNYAISNDGGVTWSQYIEGDLSPQKGTAVSHGVFLVHQEKLWFFAPQFKGDLNREKAMMRMCAYVFDEAEEKFCPLGTVLDERFWPMCEPILMDDGNYIIPGIYVGSGYYDTDNGAAVAISHQDDLLHWDMVKLPIADDVQVWGECCIVAEGSHLRLYCREHSRKLVALYSESSDFGRTWTTLGASNLPMIDSKPYSGTLSDGRHYLISSCAQDITARNPLTIALTRPGEADFSTIYTVDSGKILSYPYAIEIDRKLYIAYSSSTEGRNRNSAVLAIVDIEDLKS